MRLAFKARDAVHRAAMRAERAIRLADGFEVRPGRVFVVEHGIGEVCGHRLISLTTFLTEAVCDVKYIIGYYVLITQKEKQYAFQWISLVG